MHQLIEANAHRRVGTHSSSPLSFHSQAMWRGMPARVDLGMSPIQVISVATQTG